MCSEEQPDLKHVLAQNISLRSLWEFVSHREAKPLGWHYLAQLVMQACQESGGFRGGADLLAIDQKGRSSAVLQII